MVPPTTLLAFTAALRRSPISPCLSSPSFLSPHRLFSLFSHSIPSRPPSHRCSPNCLHHLLNRSFATTSPNPFPTATPTHFVSPDLPPNFHPADPEIEGFKTRLSVERRVFKAFTSLPKFKSNPALLASTPPFTPGSVDAWPIGHDDPLALLTFDAMGADSLDKVELVVAVEKEFSHEFKNDEYENFNTVGDLIEAILWDPEAT